MATSKIVLPRKVAEAIECLYEIGLSEYGIANRVGHRQRLGFKGLTPHLRVIERWIMEEQGRDVQLMKALTNGYDIEENREEMLLMEYKAINRACTTRTEFGRLAIERRSGLQSALSILGITIEGINDKE